MSSELLWFISGSSNINDLKDLYKNNRIWDANYKDYLVRLGIDNNGGDMGRVYGTQWRSWPCPDGQQLQQLQAALHSSATHAAPRCQLTHAVHSSEPAAVRVGTSVLPIWSSAYQLISRPIPCCCI